MAHLDEIDVRLRAIRVVIDLLMWHGLDAFISEGNEIDLEEINGFSQDSASQVDNIFFAILVMSTIINSIMRICCFSFAT